MTIRVLVVDDQELVRSGLSMIVDSQPDLEVVAEAASGEDAVDQCRRHRVDVVLMDIRMPGIGGIGATQAITAEPDPPRVIVVTTFDLDENAFAALRAGASGFLLKSTRAEDVIEAIRTVHAGDAVIAPSTTRRLIEHVAPTLPGGTSIPAEFDRLTAREREILVEVASGDSNADIARRLHVSEATVKTHVGRLLHKLGVRDRVGLAVLAYETRLVVPGA